MRATVLLLAVLLNYNFSTAAAVRWRDDLRAAVHHHKGGHDQGLLVLVPKTSSHPTEFGIADIAHALRIIKAHAWPR